MNIVTISDIERAFHVLYVEMYTHTQNEKNIENCLKIRQRLKNILLSLLKVLLSRLKSIYF